MTYTLDNIPDDIDRALRARAAAEQKSEQQAILDALARGLGITLPRAGDRTPQADSPIDSSESGCSECERPDTSITTYTTNEYGAILVRPATTDAAGNPLPKRRDLSFMAEGPPLEPEVLEALEAQRRIDPELWK